MNIDATIKVSDFLILRGLGSLAACDSAAIQIVRIVEECLKPIPPVVPLGEIVDLSGLKEEA